MSADLRAVLAEALKSVNVKLDGVVVSFSSTADLGLLADALAAALRGKVVAASEVRPMSDDEMPKDREWTDLEWRLNQLLAALEARDRMPRVVCLCGSTRFYKEFQIANYEETMAGRIVLSVGFYPHSVEHHETVGLTNAGYPTSQKSKLDELHLRKIDLADEVLVLNVGGYIGESTRREIAHAQQTGKPIRYLTDARATRKGERPTPEGSAE